MEKEIESNTSGGKTNRNPAQSYNEAKGDLVYRLSELMFGSLLAAYVLGFVGFTAYLNPSSLNLLLVLPQLVTYLFISTTFAYLTAATYLSYHSDILTLPTMPLNRMRYDFIIAVLQGILFGLSMLFPLYFPLFFSIGLWISILRKSIEFMSLNRVLIEMIQIETIKKGQTSQGIPRYQVKNDKHFKKIATKVIRSFSEGSAESTVKNWLPVSKGVKFWTGVLTLIGLTQTLISILKPKMVADNYFYILPISSGVLALSVYISVHRTFPKKQSVVSEIGLNSLNSGLDNILKTIKSNLNEKSS